MWVSDFLLCPIRVTFYSFVQNYPCSWLLYTSAALSLSISDLQITDRVSSSQGLSSTSLSSSGLLFLHSNGTSFLCNFRFNSYWLVCRTQRICGEGCQDNLKSWNHKNRPAVLNLCWLLCKCGLNRVWSWLTTNVIIIHVASKSVLSSRDKRGHTCPDHDFPVLLRRKTSLGLDICGRTWGFRLVWLPSDRVN